MNSTRYSQVMFEGICTRIVAGESVRSACRSQGAPNRRTLYRWLAQHPELHAPYLEACAIRSLYYAELMLDELDPLDAVDSQVHINAIRAKIDVYKWTAMRLQPKVYGNIIKKENERSIPNPPSREQLLAAVTEILHSLGLRAPKEVAPNTPPVRDTRVRPEGV